MTFQEASHFIEKINFTPGETWADLGAGSGTFTIPFWKLKEMTLDLDLTEAVELNRKTSMYGNGGMYLAISEKRK